MRILPDTEDTKNSLIAIISITIGFIGFYRTRNFGTGFELLSAAFLAILSREIGQRLVAQFVKTEVKTNISTKGTLVTVLTGIGSYVIQTPIILLFTVFNSFSNKRYESWGYEIDVPWVKRRYWIAWVGIATMLVFAFISFKLNNILVSKSISIYALFQLIPMKETPIIDGELDGAHILLHSGWMWLFLTGAAILGIVSPL